MTRALLWILVIALPACAQEKHKLYSPDIETIEYRLGETIIPISIRTYGRANGTFFVHLHANEQTAREIALNYLEKNGGQILLLENGAERNISFIHNNKSYKFDPNRIYNTEGIIQTLKRLSTIDEKAVRLINTFAETLLDKIPDSLLVVALHNNTDKNYSILDYHSGMLRDKAAAVHIAQDRDIDNFIFTTDSAIYNHYKNAGVNAVLQKKFLPQNDGSLSVYFGNKNRSYINIEAEHGQGNEQLEMLQLLFLHLERKKKNFH